ncbi:MAG: TonB family protein [Candidatus Omnitrophota bacterium]|nr:TonB family protein [Candidatus Omnitrophota bacterium]
MYSDNKIFRIALFVSLIVHGGIVFLPHLRLMSPIDESKKMELTYLKAKSEEAIKLKNQLPRRDIRYKERFSTGQGSNLKAPLPKWEDFAYKVNAANRPLPFSRQDNFVTNKPQLSKPDVIAVKKKIALTPLELNKITNPSYISYYQIVREKIRRCAYQNYTSQDTGEVYISFVIAADGNLTNAKVIDEKSTPNNYLKEIAIKSLQSASAFPAFPKDLDYPELTFNVIISFEIE